MKSIFKKFKNKSKGPSAEEAGLYLLSDDDPAYLRVGNLFEKGWLHPDKPKPFVHFIFEIRSTETLMGPFFGYLKAVQDAVGPWNADTAQRLLFHGTGRACALGETPTNVTLCGSPNCAVCCIAESSFDIALCGSRNQFSRFGAGIYTTSCSSKADDYVSNAGEDSRLRALLVSCVVVGKAYKMTRTSTKIVCPPHGNHSIIGVPGEDLNYEETVVYTNEAIRPLFLIMYGSAPEQKKWKLMKRLLHFSCFCSA